MALSVATVAACAVCGDRVAIRKTDCCGRCQQLVCRACSHRRGRTHESVLCDPCRGARREDGLRSLPAYRLWKRFLVG
jgi:hypothetical protein